MNKQISQQTKRKRKKVRLWGALALFIALLLFLTHDIIITNILAYRICKGDPQPKAFIKKTVEYPGSIYWEDKVSLGFDETDRLFMILNYLDGIHLKTLALNAPDGTIYVYSASEKDWKESLGIKAKKSKGNFIKTLNKEAQKIAERGVNCTHQTMPQMNYSVTFNVVYLTLFERNYLWSDDVTITDERKNEVIAYNRRLMHRWYMILPDFELGDRYYSPDPMCGSYPSVIGFPYEIFSYLLSVNSGAVPETYNSRINRIFKGGEK